MRQETIEKHIDDLYEIKNGLLSKSHRLQELREKLHVDYTGDVLQGNFVMKFNQFPKPQGDIQQSIITEFVTKYGLQLEDDIKRVDNCISFMETVTRKANYCEVDLLGMSDRKEPVEC